MGGGCICGVTLGIPGEILVSLQDYIGDAIYIGGHHLVSHDRLSGHELPRPPRSRRWPGFQDGAQFLVFVGHSVFLPISAAALTIASLVLARASSPLCAPKRRTPDGVSAYAQ